MSDNAQCCEWCGEEFEKNEMATAELCKHCVEYADNEVAP